MDLPAIAIVADKHRKIVFLDVAVFLASRLSHSFEASEALLNQYVRQELSEKHSRDIQVRKTSQDSWDSSKRISRRAQNPFEVEEQSTTNSTRRWHRGQKSFGYSGTDIWSSVPERRLGAITLEIHSDVRRPQLAKCCGFNRAGFYRLANLVADRIALGRRQTFIHVISRGAVR